MDAPEHHVRLSDGTRLHVVRGGEADPEVTVVLAHGYALDHRCWDALAALLPNAVEHPIAVLSYDQRGHGRSTRATKRTATVPQLAEDLAELIERAVAHGPVVVVGHGMGGHTALALRAAHPELFEASEGAPPRVAGLVLLSTGRADVAAEVRAATGLAVDSSSGVPAVINKLMWDLEAVVGSKVVELVTDRAHKAAVTAMRWSLFGDEPNNDDLVLTLRMIRQHWPKTMALFRPGLDAFVKDAKLDVPPEVVVAALVGERDRLVTPEQAAAVLGSEAGDGLLVLPRLGHMLPLEGVAQVLPRVVAVVHAVRRRMRDLER